MKLNKYIDHTLLKADANRQQIIKLCQEAREHKFASVCVNPFWVSLCAQELKDCTTKVCTVIGFPLGANTTEIKGLETKKALEDGADEIDMVINIGALKSQQFTLVLQDIEKVVANAQGKTVKVIIEAALLSTEEKIKACELALAGAADFVKTSTGFATGGAKIDDVKLMREVVLDKMLIKASGGIKTKKEAQTLIEAGANRIGTSNGVELVK